MLVEQIERTRRGGRECRKYEKEAEKEMQGFHVLPTARTKKEKRRKKRKKRISASVTWNMLYICLSVLLCNTSPIFNPLQPTEGALSQERGIVR